ncbi:unnamed protein product [Rotaria sordida]|uniref:Uncharacterized protein n=1 Tax=Rotaria sordida TaxID=392033 RepID=A0A814Q2I1_9BILA|nr:unnamed protein product [Rotaria sordida]
MFTPVLVLLTIVISVADAYRLPVVVVTSKEDLSVKKQKLEETIAPSLNPSYYSSQLTINHPKFARNGGFGANYYYENLRLTVPAGGLYTFQCDSYIDSFASLYFTSFNPSNSATNLYWSIDDANSDNWEFKFAINFPSAYTMDFVVTTYSSGVTGPFQIVATGPNKATFNRISSIGNSNNG